MENVTAKNDDRGIIIGHSLVEGHETCDIFRVCNKEPPYDTGAGGMILLVLLLRAKTTHYNIPGIYYSRKRGILYAGYKI